MKNHDSSSPFNRALDKNNQFIAFMATVMVLMTAGMIFIFLPSEAQFAISGILLFIGTTFAIHLIHEKVKEMNNIEEKPVMKVSTLPRREIIAKRRSAVWQKMNVAA